MTKELFSTHEGELKIMNKVLPCAVLKNGTRVINEASVFSAFERPVRGTRESDKLIKLPNFIAAKNLLPYIDTDVREVIKIINFTDVKGKKKKGYKAEILPMLCDVYLQARKDKKLNAKQTNLGEISEIMVRSLSKVGITALVDEATGYQYERDKDALSKILEAYIAKELLPWTKRFPDEFYEQMFKLRGWKYPTVGNARPGVVGRWTNDIVYERMPEGILEELRSKNPKDKKGRFKNKHHQYLTPEIGNRHLEKHITGVIALMRASSNWDKFKSNLQRAYPKMGEQIELIEDQE